MQEPEQERVNGGKLVVEEDNTGASFEAYEQINNSFSAAKETDSVQNTADKENFLNPNSILWKSYLSDISEKSEVNSHLYDNTPQKLKMEVSADLITPNKSPNQDSQHQTEGKKSALNSERKPLSEVGINTSKKSQEIIASINEEGVYAKQVENEDQQESIYRDSQKQSALLEALAHNNDSYEDTVMMQLNRQLWGEERPTVIEENKEGFEILEINNSTSSPTKKSSSVNPKTPVKVSQSDSKVPHMRKINFDIPEPSQNEENKRVDDFKGIPDSSLSSLSMSKISDHKKSDTEEDNELEKTLTISPPAMKDWAKGAEFEQISKELGIDNNSPSDDFSINEKDLDENYNANIYTEEQEIIEDGKNFLNNLENKQNNLKNYYLKNSNYLSGITEQSVEESEFVTSYEGVTRHFVEDKETKRLKISKYSCSDDDNVKKDSIAFLYSKYKEQLESQSQNSDDPELPLSLNPFAHPENNNPEHVEEAQIPEVENKQTTSEDPIRQNLFKSDPTEHQAKTQSVPEPAGKEATRYQNFRQDSRGILTIDELWDDNKSTPTREDFHQAKKTLEEASNLTFNTVSIHKSDINLGVGI